MRRVLLAAIGFYKRLLSPALHSFGLGGCKFRPTCSEYAAEAITMHGAARGTVLAVWRLLRCHPFSPGGFDPVPLPPTPIPTTVLTPATKNRRRGPQAHEPLP